MHPMKRSSMFALAALALSLSLTPQVHANAKKASQKGAQNEASASANGPTRQQVLDLVKNTCSERIGELLGKAMPTQQATPEQVSDICTCVHDRVKKEPLEMGADELQHESTYHALNCTQPLVREYNAGWVRGQFGNYLVAKRAWKAESVDKLALCLADTLWSQNYNPDRHGKRQEPSGADYWALCAGKAGHADEPLPTPEAVGMATAEEPKAKP
jgi:hypothetical protein